VYRAPNIRHSSGDLSGCGLGGARFATMKSMARKLVSEPWNLAFRLSQTRLSITYGYTHINSSTRYGSRHVSGLQTELAVCYGSFAVAETMHN